MKVELANYRMTQKVYEIGKPATVKIVPRGAHAKFDTEKTYIVWMLPMEHSLEALIDYSYEQKEFTIDADGCLSFGYTFDCEQQYVVRVIDKKENCQLEFPVYAVESDLYTKIPMKGDLHVHSSYSDGQEEPVVVAANYRKQGFDFLAITDHMRHYPSVEAVNRFEGIPSDLHLFYGEEVHIQGDYVHAVNFGGRYSVNDYYLENEERSIQEAQELAKDAPFENAMDRLDYGRRQWIAQEIQKAGGMAILVHPYWIHKTYNMREKMTNALLRNNVYNALELLGGLEPHENTLQLAQYHELRAEGCKIPVVGSSDSHGTEPPRYFGKVFTLAFVDDTTLEGIQGAVQGGYSVAVENYTDDYTQSFGALRIVKFANFLLSEYYPEYMELCFEQGRALKAHLIGEKDETVLLNALHGRTTCYRNAFYGKTE